MKKQNLKYYLYKLNALSTPTLRKVTLYFILYTLYNF